MKRNLRPTGQNRDCESSRRNSHTFYKAYHILCS